MVIVLVWCTVAAVSLLAARSDLAAGARSLRAVRSRADIAELAGPGSTRDLASARRSFERGSHRLASPALLPLRILPVASRHLAAARSLAKGSTEAVGVAERALASVRRVEARPHRSGPDRLALLGQLADVAATAERELAAVRFAAHGPLLPPLADAIGEVKDDQAKAVRAASQLRDVAAAVAAVLRGPQPYLLLGANNAEMRDGSGMFLSAATLSLRGGEIQLGSVAPTETVVLPPRTVPVRGDLAANWPWLDPGRDLRNLGLTADFPQSAAIAADNWARVPGGSEVGGVISVDVDALRSLLRAVGPVKVGGVRYTADNVREELLRNQYRRAEDRTARRDQLGEVARAIFDRLQQGRWKVDDLASQLVDAVAGRHLLVWSRDAGVEQAWSDVGADGHLRPTSVSVGLLNRAAIKVDSWVDTSTDVSTEPRRGGRSYLTIRYQIHDGSPGSGPPYLAGPNVPGLAAGDLRGLVVVNLPAGTTNATMTGATPFLEGGDGPTSVIGGEVTVAKGQTVTVTVTALLPPGLDHLDLEPAARIPATRWTVNGSSFDRDRRRSVPIR
jgi:hypothetical protein